MSRRAAGGRVAALVVGLVGAITLPASPLAAQTGANPTLRPWTSTTDLPEARSRLGAVFNDGFVYLLGGVGPNGVPATSTSFVAPVGADGTVGPWSTTTPLPGPRRTIRPAVWNDVIYLVGGNDGNNFQSTVYYARLNADGTIGPWTGTTALPGPSTAHSTVAYNGYLYVVGGNTGTTCVSTVQLCPHQRRRHPRCVDHHEPDARGPLRQRRGRHGRQRRDVRGRRLQQRRRHDGGLLRDGERRRDARRLADQRQLADRAPGVQRARGAQRLPLRHRWPGRRVGRRWRLRRGRGRGAQRQRLGRPVLAHHQPAGRPRRPGHRGDRRSGVRHRRRPGRQR